MYRQEADQSFFVFATNTAIINLNKTAGLEIINNILDLSEPASSTKAACILLPSSENKIYVGSGNIHVVNINEHPESNEVANHLFGIYSRNVAGVFVQNTGTTFNAESYIYNIAFNSPDGQGMIFENTTITEEQGSDMFVPDGIIIQSLSVKKSGNALFITAEENLHSHKLCGFGSNETCVHKGIDAHTETIYYSKIVDGQTIPESGRLYLDGDFSFDTVTLIGDLYICLNGHNITSAGQINANNYSVYITNCQNTEVTYTSADVNTINIDGGDAVVVAGKGLITFKTANFINKPENTSKIPNVFYNIKFTSLTPDEFVANRVIRYNDPSVPKIVLSKVTFDSYKTTNNILLIYNEANTNYLYDLTFKNIQTNSANSLTAYNGTFNGENIEYDTITTTDYRSYAMYTSLPDSTVFNFKNFKIKNSSFGGGCVYAGTYNFSGDSGIYNCTSGTNSGDRSFMQIHNFTNSGTFTIEGNNYRAAIIRITAKDMKSTGILNIKNNTHGTAAGSLSFIDMPSATGELSISGELNISGNDLTNAKYFFSNNTASFDLTGRIIIENNKTANDLIELAKPVVFKNGTTIKIINNTLKRVANQNQYIFSLSAKDATMTLEGNASIEVTGNLLDCTTSGTDGYYAAAFAFPFDTNTITLGNGPLVVRNNKATSSNADSTAANHMFGFYSKKAEGCILQASSTTFNTNNYIENVVFDTADGQGILYKNWNKTAEQANNYFTVDKTIISDLDLYIYEKDLWIKSGSDPFHIHKICGAMKDEKCNHDSIDAHTDTVIYQKLSPGGTMPTFGKVYLSDDFTMSGVVTLTGDLYLCLNGHKLTSKRITGNSSYNLYVTNCQENEVLYENATDSWVFHTGALQMIAGKGAINCKSDVVFQSSENTKLEKDSFIYNVAFKPVKETVTVTQSIFNVQTTVGSKFVVSSVSIADYKFNSNNRSIMYLSAAPTINTKLTNIRINNVTPTDDMIKCLTSNATEGEYEINNLTVTNSNIINGKSLIASNTANTPQVRFTGTTKIDNNNINAYLIWMNNANAVYTVDSEFIVKNNEITGTVLYVVNGTLNINGKMLLENNTFKTGNLPSIINSNVGSVNIKGDIELNKNTQSENDTTYSLINKSSSKGSMNLTGNITITDNDFSKVPSIIKLPTLDNPDDFKMTGNIVIDNNILKTNILDIPNSFKTSSDVTITDNTITRQENMSQGIVYITGSDIDVEFLGNLTIKNNKVNCDISGTENTYVSALYIPSKSYLVAGTKTWTIIDNIATGNTELVDQNPWTHMYGVLSQNVDGFIKDANKLTDNSLVLNIGFSTNDGFGMVSAGFGTYRPSNFTADNIKQYDLEVHIIGQDLWIKDNTPVHTHKTCGLSSDETCSDTTHKNITDKHEVKFYGKLTSADVFPTEGSIYLVENYDEAIADADKKVITLTNDIYICLNGHNLTLGYINAGGYNVNITNCQDTQAIIEGFDNPSVNNNFVTEGSLNAVAAKGAIGFVGGLFYRLTKATNINTNIYNVAFSRKDTATVTASYLDFSLSTEQSERKWTIASASFVSFGGELQRLFYLKNIDTINLYDVRVDNIPSTQRLMETNSEEMNINFNNLTVNNVSSSNDPFYFGSNTKLNFNDVEIKNVTLTGAKCLMRLEANTIVNVKNTEFNNISGSTGCIFHKSGSTATVGGQLNLLTNVELKNINLKFIFDIGGYNTINIDNDLTISNCTLASGGYIIHVNPNATVNIKKNLNIINHTSTSTGGMIYTNGADAVVNIDGKVTVEDSSSAHCFFATAAKSTINFNNDLEILDSTLTGSLCAFEVLGTMNTKNILIDNSTLRQIFRIGSSGTFNIDGTFDISKVTIPHMIASIEGAHVIKKTWNIEDSIIQCYGIRIMSNSSLTFEDNAVLNISDNQFDMNTGLDYQAVLEVTNNNSVLDLGKSGRLIMTDNVLKVATEKNMDYSVLRLGTAEAKILVGNAPVQIYDNVVEGSTTRCFNSVISINLNGFIVQNEGTKLSAKDTLIDNISFWQTGVGYAPGIIYADFTNSNINGYTETVHYSMFKGVEKTYTGKTFAVSKDTENNVWLKEINHENHLVCGALNSHTHSDNVFTHSADDLEVLDYTMTDYDELLDQLTSGGNYFLSSDLIFDNMTTITPDAPLNLCLNGFNVSNVKFREQQDSPINITNCKSESTSVITYTGSDSLFNNMRLFGIRNGEDYNILVKSNIVADGQEIAGYNVRFNPYNKISSVDNIFNINTTLDSSCNGLEECKIEGYQNVDTLIKGTDVSLQSLAASENKIKSGFINVSGELEVYANLGFYTNTITRKNAKQTLISFGGEKLNLYGSIDVVQNTIEANQSTDKNNIFAVFNLANQYIKCCEDGDYNLSLLNIRYNEITGTSAEAGGNHLFGIYSNNEEVIIIDEGAKLSSSTIVENVFLNTDNHTGIIMAGYNSTNIEDYSATAYKEMFIIDNYIDDEIASKLDGENVTIYKAEPVYLIYNPGELSASDGKTYQGTTTLNEVKFIETVDESGTHVYIDINDGSGFKLDGAYVYIFVGEGSTGFVEAIPGTTNFDANVDGLVQTDEKGRKVIYLTPQYNEIKYTVEFNPNTGGQVEKELYEDIYYYSSDIAPAASKSEATFISYDLDSVSLDITEDPDTQGVDPELFTLVSKKKLNIGDAITKLITGSYLTNKLVNKLFDQYNLKITYYAMFAGNEDTFTVSFDGNGAKNTMAPVSYKYLDKPKVPANKFVKDGATFQGWSKIPNGPVVYKPGDVFNEPVEVIQTGIILFAKWSDGKYKPEEYVVSVGGDGGGSSGSGPIAQQILYKYVEFNQAVFGAKVYNELSNKITWNKTTKGWTAVRNQLDAFGNLVPTGQLTDGLYFINWNNKNTYYAFDKAGNLVKGFVSYGGKIYCMAPDGVFEGAMVAGNITINGTNYTMSDAGQVMNLIDTSKSGVFIYDADAGQYRYLLQGNTLQYAVNTVVNTVDKNGLPVTYVFGPDGLMMTGTFTFNNMQYTTYTTGERYGEVIK